MPGETRGSSFPLARNTVAKTIEGQTAQSLDMAVAEYLSTLRDTQRLLWFAVRAKPDGTYFASLLTAG